MCCLKQLELFQLRLIEEVVNTYNHLFRAINNTHTACNWWESQNVVIVGLLQRLCISVLNDFTFTEDRFSESYFVSTWCCRRLFGSKASFVAKLLDILPIVWKLFSLCSFKYLKLVPICLHCIMWACENFLTFFKSIHHPKSLEWLIKRS